MLSEQSFLRLLKLIPHNQTYYSPIKGLIIHHSDHPFKYENIIQEPSICIVLKGEREVYLGDRCYVFDNQHFMFCPVNVPMKGVIKQAELDYPFVVVSMKIDLSIVNDILLRHGKLLDNNLQESMNFSPWPLDDHLSQAFERLLLLHENPEDIDFLAPLIEQEIYYRLLTGKQGDKLVQMVSSGSHIQRIAKVTQYLQEHFSDSLSIEALAKLCGMSVSGFHYHFKQLTYLSPFTISKVSTPYCSEKANHAREKTYC